MAVFCHAWFCCGHVVIWVHIIQLHLLFRFVSWEWSYIIVLLQVKSLAPGEPYDFISYYDMCSISICFSSQQKASHDMWLTCLKRGLIAPDNLYSIKNYVNLDGITHASITDNVPCPRCWHPCSYTLNHVSIQSISSHGHHKNESRLPYGISKCKIWCN